MWGRPSSMAICSAKACLGIVASRSRPHREVVAGDDAGPAVDVGHAAEQVGRLEAHQAAVLVVAADPGGRADLLERAGVAHGGEALPHGQLPGRLADGHPLGAAHLGRERPALVQLLDLRQPAHLEAPLRAARTRFSDSPPAPPAPAGGPVLRRSRWEAERRAGSTRAAGRGRGRRAGPRRPTTTSSASRRTRPAPADTSVSVRQWPRAT